MEVLMLTADPEPDLVLPALDLLAHIVRVGPLVVSALVAASSCDLVVVDARTDPAAARSVCQLIGGATLNIPVMALLAEPDLVSITPDWHLDDVLLARTGPAELDARLRLSVGRHRHAPTAGNPALLTLGDLVIEPGYLQRPPAPQAAGSDLQRVRAAQIPHPAPRMGLHPHPTPGPHLGIKLPRRPPHRRRPHPPATRQTRRRPRSTHRHPQRRLPGNTTKHHTPPHLDCAERYSPRPALGANPPSQ